MRLEEARRFALSLPEATEKPHFEKSSFRIGRKIFATLPPGGEHLHVLVDEHETRASVAEDPSAFEELRWGKRLAGVRVSLRAADPQWVFELLEESWRRKAPKRVVAAFDARERQGRHVDNPNSCDPPIASVRHALRASSGLLEHVRRESRRRRTFADLIEEGALVRARVEGPREEQVSLGPGDPHVEQAMFLLDVGVGPAGAERQLSVQQPRQE